MERNLTLCLGDWTPYCDEEHHYSFVRCLEPGRLYEAVRVTHRRDYEEAEFVHQVFFMDEYTEEQLEEILYEFDYKSLDDFVIELNMKDDDPSGFVMKPDGSVDRDASPAWYIDWMYLASLMAEHSSGRTMDIAAADRLSEKIVGQPHI